MTDASVESAVAKYSGRNLKAIIGCAFFFGGWMTTMQMNYAKLADAQLESAKATETRKAEWTAWRNGVDDRQRKTAGDRFTGSNYSTAVNMAASQSPPVHLPSLRTVQDNTPQQ